MKPGQKAAKPGVQRVGDKLQAAQPKANRPLQEPFCLEEPGLLMGNVRAFLGSKQWQEIPLDGEHFLWAFCANDFPASQRQLWSCQQETFPYTLE